ncbi:MAG: efflux RND transporter periplasmic adaptor subunit [Rhodoferax sp.]|uniref:efflux RND transporter periplasmic adaptor subunit n=1 Tax=Rhodoferax sp. TaxID=50421 RepID=UPI0017CD2225|nr:efflux RND transporter periplasmic adaptor subunit [Rhodoferax sp.]NMM15295.1 efflux RND transporter periplasmic adaptor subunit [Rhodoferax sp.]NMM21009.1 efflux RND transporter periplasmic adaptor subunit [Rhodoferax sp.]
MKLKAPSSKVITLGLLGVVLLIAVGFVIRRAGPLAPVRVTVVQATEGSLTPAIYGIGTVEARRNYLIGPTTAGRVLRVLVDAGDTVKAGQLLAEMDPVDLDHRLLALDASAARASSVILVSDAQAVDAAARRELAAINARRYVELGQQSFVSAGAVESKVQEQTSADAALRAAQANQLAASQDLTRLKAERAGLLQQRQSVRLVATQDGIVLSRDAEPGSTVVAGQSVLKLVDPASLWVKARFDQGRSAGLATGLLADIVLRSNAASTLRGKVVRVELQGDSVTEERVAQIAFDALPAGISVGELAEVTLSLPATPRALLLPNAAIKRLGGQSGAWVLSESGPKFVPLRLGQASLDGQVQVLEGLQAGAQIVVYSGKEITAKSRIQIVASLAEHAP